MKRYPPAVAQWLCRDVAQYDVTGSIPAAEIALRWGRNAETLMYLLVVYVHLVHLKEPQLVKINLESPNTSVLHNQVGFDTRYPRNYLISRSIIVVYYWPLMRIVSVAHVRPSRPIKVLVCSASSIVRGEETGFQQYLNVVSLHFVFDITASSNSCYDKRCNSVFESTFSLTVCGDCGVCELDVFWFA